MVTKANEPLPLVKILESSQRVIFYCPGCDCYHSFVNDLAWNGDVLSPTVAGPLVFERTPMQFWLNYCELHIENGMIKYSPRTRHHYGGKVIMMDGRRLHADHANGRKSGGRS